VAADYSPHVLIPEHASASACPVAHVGSIPLRAKDSGNGFLRSPVSSPGRDVSRSNISEGRIEHSNSSVSSTGSRARRSVEQFDQEGGLGDGDSFDDAPMLASINSAEFRRTTDPARDPARGYGIVHSSDVAAASAGVDSLLYSPSVSTASTCSRYSVEDDGSDNEEGAAGGQGDKSWTQKSRPTSAMDDQSPFRTDSKSAGRGGGGEFGRKALGDSVDSAKMEFQSRVARRSFKPDSDRESADRLRDVGDRTLISSIPTVGGLCEQLHQRARARVQVLLRPSGWVPLGSTANTEELLSTTIDSEGDMLVRKDQGTQGILRSSEVRRHADFYERDAKSNGLRPRRRGEHQLPRVVRFKQY